MAENDAFKKCVSKCPDRSKLVIVNNWNNEEMAEQCNSLEREGAEVIRHPENIGCSGAMNIGLRKIESDDLDFVIILSPSALFTNTIQDFVDLIEKEESKKKNYYYLTMSNLETDLHAFAVMRRCVEEIGLYDENFYPVYYDDTDYGYRMKLHGVQKTIVTPDRISQDLNGGLKSDPRAFDLYWKNVDHIHNYYVRKWGGEAGQEIYKTPFNNPKLTIKDWILERDKIIWKSF